MPPNTWKRKWIKLFIDECLTGTIREDLTPDERSVWYDFLLLAGRNRPPGNISANENTPMSPQRLAAILNISGSLLTRAKKKFKESGRITVEPNGTISITNWAKYQFSDYDRQKPYREAGRIKLQQALQNPEFMSAFNRELDTLEETLPLLKEEDLESV